MPDQIFDENGNMTYQPNIWQPQDWQTAGGMSQTMPVPMQGGQPVYGTVGGNPVQGGNWWSQNSPGGQQGGANVPGPSQWTRESLQAYFDARGVQPLPTSIDYWLSKKNELDARGRELGDPNYANTFLSHADEFGGGGYSGHDFGPSGSGGGGAMSGMTPEQVMAQDPGYQFRLGEGLNAIQRGAAARGTLLTGGLQKGLQRYAQDYASGEYGNIFDRNLNLARLGQFGATGTAQGYSNAGQAAGIYGQGMAGALQNQGNVQASGTIGSGNAWSGSLGQLGNLAAIYAMNRQRGGGY